MALVLLRILAVLSLDGAPQHIHSIPLKSGATYTLHRVSATGEGSYCFTVLEERGNAVPNRALNVWCGSGDALVPFHEKSLAGGPGRAYSIVLYPRTGAPPAASVVFNLEIFKEQP